MSPEAPAKPRLLVLMGVSGSGKTTLGELLAERLGWSFVDGDSLHPEANVRRMAAGQPLRDSDRQPWLRRVRDLIEERLRFGPQTVIACSALKTSYRKTLGLPPYGSDGGVGLVHLTGPKEVLALRLDSRRSHFMPASLLQSQLDCLEPPEAPALILDIRESPTALVQSVLDHFDLQS